MITERIDRVTGIPQKYRKAFLPPPISVKIELTGRCNYSCAFCARGQMLRRQSDIDREFFERVVKEMKEAGVEELGLFYLGESFMVPWLPEAIKYAKDIGFEYVFLTTNGSLCSEKKVKACLDAGLDSLKFSYNYSDVEQFESVARVKPKLYGKMIANMKSAFEIREEGNYKCHLSASYIEFDGDQGKRMLEAVERIKPYVDEIYALPLYNQAGFVTKQEEKMGMKSTVGNRGRLDNLRDGLPCWALFSEGHITWDGILTGCCFSHTPDFDFGDLTELTFMEAWNSERAQWFREKHLKKTIKNTPCEKCFVAAA